MSLKRRFVSNFRIRSQFAKAALARPRFGGAHQRSANTGPARAWFDVPPLDVGYRHRVATVGKLAEREFEESDLAVVVVGDEDDVESPCHAERSAICVSR